MARLGELLPAKPPAERGQGRNGKKHNKESSTAGVHDLALHRNTVSAYRKVAKFQKHTEEYFAAQTKSRAPIDSTRGPWLVPNETREKRSVSRPRRREDNH